MKSVMSWAMVGAMVASLGAPGIAGATEPHDSTSRSARVRSTGRAVVRFARGREGARILAAGGVLLQQLPVRGVRHAGRYVESAGAAVVAAHGVGEAAHDLHHVGTHAVETGREVAQQVTAVAQETTARVAVTGTAMKTAWKSTR